MEFAIRALEHIGKNARVLLRHLSSLYSLMVSNFYWTFIAPFKKGQKGLSREHVSYQCVFMGNKSISIVFLVSLFMGMIMAMQTAYLLKKFGVVMYVGSLVAVSMCRELGPLLTAIVIAGRAGAAITAELGTMKVSEEIDALEVMGINPVRYLVVPRILALVIMLPCLTMFADLVGIYGGYLIGHYSINIPTGLYIQKTIDALVLKDIWTGLLKSFVFALIIGFIGCYEGLIVKGGAEGVGKATTISVVASITLIIFADCVLTSLFYFVFV